MILKIRHVTNMIAFYLRQKVLWEAKRKFMSLRGLEKKK